MQKLYKNHIIDFAENSIIDIRIYDTSHFPAHNHANAVEIILCLKGTIEIVSNFQHISLNEGEFFTIDCSDIHCIFTKGGDSALLQSVYLNADYHFKDDCLRYTYFALDSREEESFMQPALDKAIDLLLALGYISTNKPEVCKKLYINIAEELTSLLLDDFNWLSLDFDTQKLSDNYKELTFNLLSYCEQNYKEKIKLKDLSSKYHYNENYLSQYFNKTVFQSFSNMLNYIRCSNAEKILLSTNLPNNAIALECGFSDPRYYYSHFKKWYGRTPNEHKKWYVNYNAIPDNYALYAPQEISDNIKSIYCQYHCNKLIQTLKEK